MDKVKTETMLEDYCGYKNVRITIDDMPNQDMIDIARTCGIDAAIKLLQNFSGIRINIPSNGFTKIEKKIILDEYDGYAQTIKKLASRLGMTEKTVRDVLSKKGTIPSEPGQINLFPQGWSKNGKK